VDIRRFGPGHRRSDGSPGSRGVEGRVIHHDEKALVSELAFGRYGMIVPHSNPNTTLFVVISGGGYVQVGDERARVNHGEAVLWPADVPHGAYTDGSEMRAIVIEVPSADSPVLAGEAATLLAAQAQPAANAQDEESKKPVEGKLAERQKLRADYDSSEGEPW
jgi:quercetin dioxygenase-like cupin family protein